MSGSGGYTVAEQTEHGERKLSNGKERNGSAGKKPLEKKISTLDPTVRISGIVFYHSIKSTVALIAIVVVMLVLMFFSKKIEKLLDRKISKPLMDKLILNDSFRFTLLKFSAIFFTIGFFIQLALEVIK